MFTTYGNTIQTIGEQLTLTDILEAKGKYRELMPCNNQKSFYGKAVTVVIPSKNIEILFSYQTMIAAKNLSTGKIFRFWAGWSATTGKHIAAFCGLNKSNFTALPVNNYYNTEFAT